MRSKRSLLFVAGGAVALGLLALSLTTRTAVGIIPVTPYEVDVDKNGAVTVADIVKVSQHVGKPVPTVKATATPVQPPPGGTFVRTLVDSVSVGVGERVYTPIVDVHSCDHSMVLFAERSASAYFDNWIVFGHSYDGVTISNDTPEMTNSLSGHVAWATQNVQVAHLDVTGFNLAPFMRFGIENGNVAQEITVRLSCQSTAPFVDALIAEDVVVGNHQQAWFGSYRSASCKQAVLFVYAMGLEGPDGTFDFLVAGSNDGISPSGGIVNIGNSSNEGAPGSWVVHRKLSNNETRPVGGNVHQADYTDEAVPYLLVGAFANQAGRFRAEVHCQGTP